ncbi:unnamed protein product [Haemonchus placei]|uniref:C2H2-type domain-containing protein n=1 Tax=Haemonchus placei TaxID=6290 RepID=A0A0N4WJA2_HAEPC|nr:unnamed protein product [Haemonchus placei]
MLGRYHNFYYRSSVQCEKCQRNEAKYGKPTTCKFCQLPAAFHEEKCVYCSHSERKFGAPIPCANCKLRAAFTKDPKKPLCHFDPLHLCRVPKAIKWVAETCKYEKSQAEPVKVAKRDPFADSGENVLLVQQLRDQISKLHSIVAQKDAAMLEKDKKVSTLQADLMSAERKHREKVEQLLKDKDDAIQRLTERHRQASLAAKTVRPR